MFIHKFYYDVLFITLFNASFFSKYLLSPLQCRDEKNMQKLHHSVNNR